MTFSSRIVAAVTVCSVLVALPAQAALTPELKCHTGKLKSVASFASCLLKTEAKAVANLSTPDFTKCRDKINDKFPKLESNAGAGVCPTEMDVADIRDRTEDFEAEIAFLLSGSTTTTTTLPPGECGDGDVNAGEECDAGNLDGETCAAQAFFNGDLHCGPGCQFDFSECNATRFEDNGLTVLDHQTGLEWEKKTNSDAIVNLANAHDADNTYAWTLSAGGTVMSGSLYTDFLTKLNGTVDHPTKTTLSCFDSHCDWRVPTVDELKTILLDPGCVAAPCVVDPLLLPNRSGGYWSNSTRFDSPDGAYHVDFTMPVLVAGNAKTTLYFARAVRRFTD